MLEIPAADVDRFIVINPLLRVREGISFLGNVLRGDKEPMVKIFRNHHGRLIPVQYVPGLDGERHSLYADFSYADPECSVPGLGAVLLEYDAGETEKWMRQNALDSSLSVGDSPGEMKNASIRLRIDPQTGNVTSLKMIGIEHDLIRPHLGNVSQNAAARITVVAAGPLVASLHVQRSDRRVFQVTIFNDSEQIRFDGLDAENLPFQLHVPRHQKLSQSKWYPYTVWANEECGVNVVRHKTECWLWPYTATFNGGIALRFASRVQKPLVRLTPNEIVQAVPGMLLVSEDRLLSAVNVHRDKKQGGAIGVTLVNPTDETVTTKITATPPLELIPLERAPLQQCTIKPGEAVSLRLE